MNRLAKCCSHLVVVGLTFVVLTSTLIAQQQAGAANAPTDEKRLFYIGLALYSEPWSQNDVVELSDSLQRASKYHVVPLIASNVARGVRQYPIADDATIASLVRRAAEQARTDDIVFVDISSHGARQMLARKVDGNPATALPSRELARKLSPLAGHRTVIIISACFSGSMIGDLRAPERIIIAAARADRSSFGCAPDRHNTFFGEAELHAFGEPNRSLRQVFAAIRDDVAHMERADRYTPSEPQVSIGSDAGALYDAPVF